MYNNNRKRKPTMNHSNIVSVLARIYVDDIEKALPLYEQLSDGEAPQRFDYGEVRLAKVGAFLLVQDASDEVRSHAATVNVRDIRQVVDAIRAAGGKLLEGPASGPNGARLIAQHPDGTVLEYIETGEL
jgi:predicted enzyme related to lactoylglutathione lyase